MVRGGKSGLAPGGSHAGLLLLALLVGSIAPWGLFAINAASRQQFPPGCSGGPATALPSRGTVLYTDGPSLMIGRADLSDARKLVSYPSAPIPSSPAVVATPTTPASPGSSVSPTASDQPSPGASVTPVPSPSPSPSPRTSPFGTAARILA
ncbi:MAG: hypothetical protein ACYDGR_02560, partial [Candidatus Dormibacteria bacterium]